MLFFFVYISFLIAFGHSQNQEVSYQNQKCDCDLELVVPDFVQRKTFQIRRTNFRQNKRCVKFVPTPMNFFESEYYCSRRFNGHLLTILSTDELYTITNLINSDHFALKFPSNYIKRSKFFFGLRRNSEKKLEWSNGREFDTMNIISQDDLEVSDMELCGIIDCEDEDCPALLNLCSEFHPFFCETINVRSYDIIGEYVMKGMLKIIVLFHGIDVYEVNFGSTNVEIVPLDHDENCIIDWIYNTNTSIYSYFTVDSFYLCGFESSETNEFIVFEKTFQMSILNTNYMENFKLKFKAFRNVYGFADSFVYEKSEDFVIEYLITLKRVENDFITLYDIKNKEKMGKGEEVFYKIYSKVPLKNEKLYLTIGNVYLKSDSIAIGVDYFERNEEMSNIIDAVELENSFSYEYYLQFTIPRESNLGSFNYLYFSFETHLRRRVDNNHPHAFTRVNIIDKMLIIPPISEETVFTMLFIGILLTSFCCCVFMLCGIFGCVNCYFFFTKKKRVRVEEVEFLDLKKPINEGTPLMNRTKSAEALTTTRMLMNKKEIKTKINNFLSPKKNKVVGTLLTPVKKLFSSPSKQSRKRE